MKNYTPTMSDIYALREFTGRGMLDCKKALMTNNGNIKKAINELNENSNSLFTFTTKKR